MNRAAEAALPVAKQLLVESIKQVPVLDADLDSDVVGKAPNGSSSWMPKGEAAIRKDPPGQASGILRQVVGAVAT